MSFSNDERRRVEEDERYRIYSREQNALYRAQQAREQRTKNEQRQMYVARHGREGAIRNTVRKWMLGAAVWAVLSFFGSIAEDGFFKAVGAALLSFIVITGIGAIRAVYIVNSVR